MVRARGPSLGIPGAATGVDLTIKTPQTPNRWLEGWLYYDGMYQSQITALGLAPSDDWEIAEFVTLYPGESKLSIDDLYANVALLKLRYMPCPMKCFRK